ncbi:MAG: 23S rRNA (guanosine(2251)-2'-O)-methyltransferase RlmB [Bacteroidota bacterium]
MKRHKHKNPPSHIVFGVHPVLEALSGSTDIEKILIRKEGSQHARMQDVLTQARKAGIPVQRVPDEKIERVCRGNVVHQGIVALISPITYASLEDIILKTQEKGEIPLILLLDGVTDVGNFGAIARTAECMGVHAVVVPTQGSAAIQAGAVKASAGALHHVPICRVPNLLDAFLLLEAYEIQRIGCTEKAEQEIFDIDLNLPTCLIMGSEDKGISSSLLKRADYLAKIPLQGKIDSLNVSVATGMVLMETIRQRNSGIQP